MPQTFPPVYLPTKKKKKKSRGLLVAVVTEAWEMSGCQGSQAGGQPAWAKWAQPAFNHVHILNTPQLVFPTFFLYLSPRNCELSRESWGFTTGVVLKHLTLWFFFRPTSGWSLYLGCQFGAAGADSRAICCESRGVLMQAGLRLPAKKGAREALGMSSGRRMAGGGITPRQISHP